MSIAQLISKVGRKEFDFVTKCRKELSTLDTRDQISIPTLVVIGDQSNGKSSLLVRLLQLDILPYHGGTCTLCPNLITISQPIDAKNLQDEEGVKHKYRVTIKDTRSTEKEEPAFLDTEDEVKEFLKVKVKNISNSRSEFCLENHSLNGQKLKSPFSLEEIHTTIVTNETPVQLSFVDLPGLLHDDSVNAQATHEIAKGYVENENNFLILVMDAQLDKGKSGILGYLNRSKTQIPWKQRTIGVLTKSDVNNNSRQNACDYACDTDEYSLQLGWFIVINSLDGDSLLTISAEMSHIQSLQYEGVSQSQLGMQNFSQQIAECFCEHVVKGSQRIYQQLVLMHDELRTKIRELGDEIVCDDMTFSILCSNLQARFEEAMTTPSLHTKKSANVLLEHLKRFEQKCNSIDIEKKLLGCDLESLVKESNGSVDYSNVSYKHMQQLVFDNGTKLIQDYFEKIIESMRKKVQKHAWEALKGLLFCYDTNFQNLVKKYLFGRVESSLFSKARTSLQRHALSTCEQARVLHICDQFEGTRAKKLNTKFNPFHWFDDDSSEEHEHLSYDARKLLYQVIRYYEITKASLVDLLPRAALWYYIFEPIDKNLIHKQLSQLYNSDNTFKESFSEDIKTSERRTDLKNRSIAIVALIDSYGGSDIEDSDDDDESDIEDEDTLIEIVS